MSARAGWSLVNALTILAAWSAGAGAWWFHGPGVVVAASVVSLVVGTLVIRVLDDVPDGRKRA